MWGIRGRITFLAFERGKGKRKGNGKEMERKQKRINLVVVVQPKTTILKFSAP
jgi:hypothetical protein